MFPIQVSRKEKNGRVAYVGDSEMSKSLMYKISGHFVIEGPAMIDSFVSKAIALGYYLLVDGKQVK